MYSFSLDNLNNLFLTLCINKVIMLILPSVLIIFIEPLILFVYVVLYNKFNHLNKNIIPCIICKGLFYGYLHPKILITNCYPGHLHPNKIDLTGITHRHSYEQVYLYQYSITFLLLESIKLLLELLIDHFPDIGNMVFTIFSCMVLCA